MKKTTYIFSFATFVLLFFLIGTPASVAASEKPEDVTAIVENYFKDIPEMIEIARCESNLRQFTDTGNVLRGAGGDTVGLFQFHEVAHSSLAKRLGYDLATLKGNLDYAKHVYDTEGTTPWRFSAYCWEQPAKEAREQLKNNTDRVITKIQTDFERVTVEVGDSEEVIILKNKINLLIQVVDLLIQQKALTGR